MPFYETIFENGDKSVAFYEDDKEAESAATAHHERAKNGETGGPTGHAAVRIKKLLKYDTHPADFNTDQSVSSDEARAAISDLIDRTATKDGAVAIHELAAGVRELSSPFVPDEEAHPHGSAFKMKESGYMMIGDAA